MFVQNHMTPNPQTIEAGATVSAAREMLKTGRFHQLPVVDNNHNLLGMVTDRDIRSAVGYGDGGELDLRVEDIMTAEPIGIEQHKTIEEAVSLLCEHRFGALPIMRGKKLVGIITRSDILGAFLDLLGLDEPGTRIEVAIPNGAADVALVMGALGEEDEITSVIAARLRTDGAEPVLYIRTRTRNPWHLERRLRLSGAILLATESAPSSARE